MKLADLLGGILDLPDNSGDLEISGLSANSSDISNGYVFFGLPGVIHDGAKFVEDAQTRGAVAAVVSVASEIPPVAIPVFRSSDPRLVLAQAAAKFYSNQPKKIAAVTGTAGKTSIANFTRQIWEIEGKAAASLGTTGVVAPGRDDYGNLTTPDPVSLHQLLDELANDGVTHASMEASSHGLDQKRLHGVRISVAGFSNLGRDHLDYHHTIEDYFDAKMKLFSEVLPMGAPAVIFADDEFSDAAIAAATAAGADVRTVGRKGNYLSVKKVEHQQFCQIVELEHDGDFYRIEFPLAGDFQIANALVSAGMVIATGTPVDVAITALESLKGASGRLELVGKTKTCAPVYVDYAHKPEALENVLESLRPFTSGRIVLVFGCGGDRDKGKRPIMGEIADRLADVIIVTDDNPRTEDAATVRAEILATCPNALEIGDRAEAIHYACSMLIEGDCLVVAGKGHETGQIIGDTVYPFSDHDVVREAISGRAA